MLLGVTFYYPPEETPHRQYSGHNTPLGHNIDCGPMGLGQYDGLGEYCGLHTASSVFLMLLFLDKYIQTLWQSRLLSPQRQSDKQVFFFNGFYILNLCGKRYKPKSEDVQILSKCDVNVYALGGNCKHLQQYAHVHKVICKKHQNLISSKSLLLCK